MNPLRTIEGMHISIEQKIELMLVLVGFKKMARIDLYKGNDCLLLVQTALLDMGIFSHNMQTSGAPHHLHGFVVSKNKQDFEVFKEALKKKDVETLNQLLNPVRFPLDKDLIDIIQIRTKFPVLYKELEETKKLKVA